MKTATVILLLIVVAMAIDDGSCWWRRRRRRPHRPSRPKKWSLSKFGVTYNARDGATVTGYGIVEPDGIKGVGIKGTYPILRNTKLGGYFEVDPSSGKPSYGIKGTIQLWRRRRTFRPLFGRKRREIEEQAKLPTTEEDNPDGDKEVGAVAAVSTASKQTKRSREKCEECVEIKPHKMEDEVAENKTMAEKDFVMVVEFIEENKSAAKMEAEIKFRIIQVLKSPSVDGMTSGNIFTINAKLATCPCLTSLDPGHYIVTGSLDSKKRLVMSNVLLEFE